MTPEDALIVIAAYTHAPHGDVKRGRVVREAREVLWQEAEKIRLRFEENHLTRDLADWRAR